MSQPMSQPTVLSAPPSRPAILRATMIGAVAILLWSTLAALATLTGPVPPFQMCAFAFAIAFLVGVAGSALRGRSPLAYLRQPPAVWLLGVGGLFGFHFLYFLAVQSAPPVEANLLNYLWPLLIVLFSALLPGERLRWWHAAGGAAGLAGTVLLVTRGEALGVSPAYLPGYLAALASALVWSGYSVLSRRFGDVPTDAVGGFCLATSLLALACHLAFETTVWPADATGWAALVGLGLGPVGAAFFVWDHGVKHGDIQALGVLSYAAPLLSTLLLIALGLAEGRWSVWAACALIVGGALLASRDLLVRRGA
jgi:drug/metabolite transporter (DMT)-like permease